MQVNQLKDQLSPLTRGALFYFCFWSVVGIQFPFLNVYFRDDLGFSGREIGLLSTIMPMMMMMVAMPISALADRRRWHIRIMNGLLLGFGSVLLFASIPQTFAFVFLTLVMMMFMFSPMMPISDSVIARMAARHQLNYGSMRLWGSFGFATCAIICGFMWEQVGYAFMFIVGAVAILPTLISANLLEKSPVQENQSAPPLHQLAQDTGLVTLYISVFFSCIAIQCSIIFDGIYMTYLGGTEFFVGLMFGTAALCELPAMQYSGLIIQRIGGAKTLLIAYSIFGIAYFGYAMAWDAYSLLMMGALKGIGFGLFYVSSIRIITRRTPETWSSTAQAIFNICGFGLAPLIAAPIGGEIFDRFGPENLFLFASFAAGLAIFTMAIAIMKGIFRDTPPQPVTV